MEELLILETAGFEKWVSDNALRAEVNGLHATLAANSDAGDVIPGGNGFRKVRMGGRGRGKRGGFRVVYVLLLNRAVAVLVDGYSKAEKEDLSADELKKLVKRLDNLRATAARVVADLTGEG